MVGINVYFYFEGIDILKKVFVVWIELEVKLKLGEIKCEVWRFEVGWNLFDVFGNLD